MDRIDVKAVDAQKGPGNQVFRFVGTAAFTNVPGELRAFQAGTSVIIEGNTNADSVAEFQIELESFSNLAGLTSADFIR